MLTAITHAPSPHMNQCELTFLSPDPIDVGRAARQHEAYCGLLAGCGVKVMVLDQNLALPDSVFVEDTAVVLDEIAIMTPMGVASRQPETALIERELAKFRPLSHIHHPAKLEGGDVLRVGRKLFVGLSSRTNQAGVAALENIVHLYGYEVVGVKVTGCLHLKTGCTALDEQTILLNPAWVDPAPFAAFECLAVPPAEPFAANVLRLGQTIGLHAGFEQTQQLLTERGYAVRSVDIGEFLKAEAGLTCMSLLFEG